MKGDTPSGKHLPIFVDKVRSTKQAFAEHQEITNMYLTRTRNNSVSSGDSQLPSRNNSIGKKSSMASNLQSGSIPEEDALLPLNYGGSYYNPSSIQIDNQEVSIEG